MTYQSSWLAGQYTDFTQWKSDSRKILRQALLTPDSTIAFAAEKLDQQDRGSYFAEKIAFNITDESRVQGLLLTPKRKGPHPAIVLLHDHGSKFDIGKEKMIRPWGDSAQLASAQAWSDKFFSGKFIGDELAKRGYVVLSIDALGWGDRGPMSYEQQQALASNFFNLGRSLAGNMAYEDMRTVDFMATMPSVDRQRIGALGFSMGAYRAWQLAALSDKVAATAAISWFGSYQGLMTPGNNVLRGQSAFYMLHPGIANKLDFPDIASLAAPKPMLLFNGGKDKLFPSEAVEQAYSKVHAIWRSQNAESRLITRSWPTLGHVFYQEQQDVVFPWLDRWLKP
ncbi:TPA: dienelactone hydrolase family protein [Yersinia enterocolitica]|nr:dienelactone hydrolase family protein [Yersinia enterocolitica]